MAAPAYTPATGYGTQSGGYTFTQNGWIPSSSPSNSSQLYPNSSQLPPNSSLLPASTNNSAPAPTVVTSNNPQPQTPQVATFEDQYKSEIGAGYDKYLADLDEILYSGLPGQQDTQNKIIESQYDQGVNTLDTQKTLGLSDLDNEAKKIDTSQVKSLKDVSSNIRNIMQAGNTYLGARGAGDSSAVNQYSYALTKLGSQQRGNILSQSQDLHSQVADRKYKLNTLYGQELSKLQSDRDQKVLGVLSWYNDSINNIKTMKSQVGFNKSMDIASLSKAKLDQAYQQLAQINADSMNKKNILETWALNNSNSLAELQGKLASISEWQASNIMYSPLTMGGNMLQGGQQPIASYGGSGYSDDEDLFS